MFKSMKPLKKYIIMFKKQYILGIFFLLFTDIVQLYIPQILKMMANEYQNSTLSQSSVIRYALFTIGLGALTAMGRYFWRIYLFGNARNIEYHMRNEFFDKLTELSANFYKQNKTGDLMARATNDIRAVWEAMGPGIMFTIDAVFLLIFTSYKMLRNCSLQFLLTVMIPIFFVMVTVTFFGKMIYRRFLVVQAAYSSLADESQECFSGIRIIKSFCQEKTVRDSFKSINKEYLDKNIELAKIKSVFDPLVALLCNITYFILMYFGAKEVINNTMDLGSFVAFFTYLALMMWPARAMGITVNAFQRAAASMDRLSEIFNAVPEIKEGEGAVHINKIDSIKFHNVSFKYSDAVNCAIKNINFEVKKGQTLAIVGSTASGKSSLVNLILRIYDRTEGSILINNHDIKNLKLRPYREEISYVPQDDFLFSKSIEENITFHFESDEYDNDDVIKYAKLAHIYDDIIQFNDGFDTVLGERGVTLSGGQKQRVSIARALIKKSSVLILDDALSAVDTETEDEILKDLYSTSDGRISIIISHRISTIKNADEILYMEDGEIIERGTHDELIKFKGKYFKLHQDQLLEDEIERSDDGEEYR